MLNGGEFDCSRSDCMTLKAKSSLLIVPDPYSLSLHLSFSTIRSQVYKMF